jgi:SAM-dependent methyltransferase
MARQGSPRDRTTPNIRAFWEGEAEELGESPQVTIRDLCFRVHELNTLLAFIPRSPRLLDAGCGNGLGTLVLSQRAQRVVGVDSSPGMIALARRLQSDPAYRMRMVGAVHALWPLPVPEDGRLEFLLGDVVDLHLSAPPFDVITAQRLLINLPSEADQRSALRDLRRHAADGGLLVLSETTEQGYGRTDSYRARYGLSNLERHWHNLYLDETRLQDWPEVGWRVERILGFETYMLLSKVVYPAACGEARCQFLSAANVAAMEMACLFRSRLAVDEVGPDAFFRMYADRVARYDAVLGGEIAAWITRHAATLPDWRNLGHQRVILARAC